MTAGNTSLPQGYPRKMGWRGNMVTFTEVAPITGDLIYQGARQDGTLFHIIITNPDARERQRRYLLRRV